ncbi:hypothetical protein [Bradyrhizobium sp. SRS-191]|uniref:hypothetical protein n=1 Tax=Bradyrhizobium sp. SRS-191 TaxID=2962606 RepID=UPI00211F26EE|nr:hypothetical protein [Bradyrhizobium sp. SRS-191]
MSDDELDVGSRGALQAVLTSLNKIRSAKSRLQVRSSDNATPAALMAQIELCNTLLDEIQSISCSLDKRVEHAGAAPSRRPVANRRHRGTAHLIVPRRAAPGRTKQQR